MNYNSLSQAKFEFSRQAQSFNTLPTHILINNVEVEKNDVLISLENNEIIKENSNNNPLTSNNNIRFEHHIMYPLLLKLIDHRDSLYFNTNLNELLSRTKELSDELSKFNNLNDINVN